MLAIDMATATLQDSVTKQLERSGMNASLIEPPVRADSNWFSQLLSDTKVEAYQVNHLASMDADWVSAPVGFEELIGLQCSLGSLHSLTDQLYGRNGAVIGYPLWQKLNYPQLGETIILEGLPLELIGILEKDSVNLYFNVDKAVFVGEGYLPDSQNEFYVSKDAEIKPWLDEQFGSDNYLLVDQQAIVTMLNRLTELIRWVMTSIGLIAGINAVIGMLGQILADIDNQLATIGLYKSLGADNYDIFIAYLGQLGLMMIGAVVMAFFGLTAVVQSAVMAGFSLQLFSRSQIKLVGLLSLVAMMGALWPAYKASRVSVMQALKHGM